MFGLNLHPLWVQFSIERFKNQWSCCHLRSHFFLNVTYCTASYSLLHTVTSVWNLYLSVCPCRTQYCVTSCSVCDKHRKLWRTNIAVSKNDWMIQEFLQWTEASWNIILNQTLCAVQCEHRSNNTNTTANNNAVNRRYGVVVCSPPFVAVNRNKLQQGISVHRPSCALRRVALCRVLTVCTVDIYWPW